MKLTCVSIAASCAIMATHGISFMLTPCLARQQVTYCRAVIRLSHMLLAPAVDAPRAVII